MRHLYVVALVLGTLDAGIASPQTLPADLTKYLNLTDPQAQAIVSLNTAFGQYVSKQESLYYTLQAQASVELVQDSPDPGVVGGLYGQMEMIKRDYNAQLALVQGKVAAVLTMDQAVIVSGLLAVARLQPLVSEAQSVYLEPPEMVPTAAYRSGDFSVLYVPQLGSCCYGPQMPTALVNYFNLSDAQNAAIENAIQANQNYLQGQSLKIQELQYAIQALTAAQTIDTATLGADYVAIAQIQRDETTQGNQLITTVRGVITDQQQPQLKALDNALNLGNVEYEAVQSNILVLPPDVGQSYSPFGYSGFLLGIPTAGTIY